MFITWDVFFNIIISTYILASIFIPALSYKKMILFRFFLSISNHKSSEPEMLFMQIMYMAFKITFLLHFHHLNINIFFFLAFYLYKDSVAKQFIFVLKAFYSLIPRPNFFLWKIDIKKRFICLRASIDNCLCLQ